MSHDPRVLAVIPARGGSKGLPGKNTRPFAGLPLIAHSILFAKLCPSISRCVVSTDSEAIADVARQFGGDVPFLRAGSLAADDTPLWPVIRDALARIEQAGERYDFVLLLDPTSPAREPTDVSLSLTRLRATPDADGVISVSRPTFNPIWHCVVERDGYMADLFESSASHSRRQDVRPVYRINGSLYLWRTAFVQREATTWRGTGHYLLHEIPERRAMSIDSLEEFEDAESLVTRGRIRLPWLEAGAGA